METWEFFSPQNKEISVNLINGLSLYGKSSVSYIHSFEKFPLGVAQNISTVNTCSISAETSGTIIPVALATTHKADNLLQLTTELLMRTVHQAGVLFFNVWVWEGRQECGGKAKYHTARFSLTA